MCHYLWPQNSNRQNRQKSTRTEVSWLNVCWDSQESIRIEDPWFQSCLEQWCTWIIPSDKILSNKTLSHSDIVCSVLHLGIQKIPDKLLNTGYSDNGVIWVLVYYIVIQQMFYVRQNYVLDTALQVSYLISYLTYLQFLPLVYMEYP